MAAKIISFFSTLLVEIVAGIIILSVMLLAMNGYSESDALWGLLFYLVVAVVASIVMAGGAAVAVDMLTKREFTSLVSALIAIPVFSVAGILIEIVGSLIGIAVSEYVRVNY